MSSTSKGAAATKKMNPLEVLKAACSKFHPDHVQALHAEVMQFSKLVQQKTDFEESKVLCFGDVENNKEARQLSNMAFVEEGIPYMVDGCVKLFDSAQHLYEFLVHGIPDQVDLWARGGCMSCYTHVFGEEKGRRMKESEWKDFVGIIPFILVKPKNEALRAALGVELKQAKNASNKGCTEQYMLWRPVLLAKYQGVKRLGDLLASTRGKYLLDKVDPSKLKEKQDADMPEGGCILYAKPKKSAGAQALEAYEEAKKNGNRTHGKLAGRNRTGRFLMAIRSEILMMRVVAKNQTKNTTVAGKKRKLTEVVQ